MSPSRHIPPGASPTWEDAPETLHGLAELDLRAHGRLRPMLIAFDGDDPLAIVELRPAERPGQPIIEALALVVPLGARRLALSIGTRVWSLEDPIPPVVEGVGDLRQRAVMILTVDAAGADDTMIDAVLHPFDLGESGPRWDGELRLGSPDEDAWIPNAMRTVLEEPGLRDGGPGVVRAQLQRCDMLGHRVMLAPLGTARLSLSAGGSHPSRTRRN